MREKVRRSFVTDLAGFRHLFIRQPEGFVIRATGPDLAYDIGILIEDSSGRAILGMSRPEVIAHKDGEALPRQCHCPGVRNRALYDMYTDCMREGTFLRPLELVRSAARALRLALHIVLGSYPYLPVPATSCSSTSECFRQAAGREVD